MTALYRSGDKLGRGGKVAESDLEEELRTRRGQFLKVEKIGDQYKETSMRGETTTYSPRATSDICITKLAFHTKIDISNGGVRHYATGSTTRKVRAIGTEGSYFILDVLLSPETPIGTAIVSHTYARDGHCMNTSMKVGLSEDAIAALKRESERGNLCLNQISGPPLFIGFESMLLDYWREHVIANEDGSDDIRTEQVFKFDTATYSPDGYMAGLGYFAGDDTTDVRIANKVSFQFSEEGEHPIQGTLETLIASVASYSKLVSWSIFIIVVAVGVLILRTL